jgi:hypothetical protein
MKFLRWLIAACIPILFVMINVRLVMSPLFLQIEYHRPGFPDDPYGFTREDRVRFAPYALDYLIYSHDISYLADLEFPDGRPLFNTRELYHMRDVQALTTAAYALAWAAAGVLLLASLFSVLNSKRRTSQFPVPSTEHQAPSTEYQVPSTEYRIPSTMNPELLSALHFGGWLTLSLIGVIVVFALVGWQMFFTGFHTLFFADGTWYFLTSDTLIRMFPEQFWFDAALTIGGLTAAEAGLLAWAARRRL